MGRLGRVLAGAVLCAAFVWSPANAAVKSLDIGLAPANDQTGYQNTTGLGAIDNFIKFYVDVAPTGASVSYSNTVKVSGNIANGLLQLFQCASNCTGSGNGAGFSPVAFGPAIASAMLATEPGGGAQTAGFGPALLLTAGYYFLELTGSTTATGNGLLYNGTISLSSAVPEPGTWAMMLAGFAGLAFIAARRRKTAVSIA